MQAMSHLFPQFKRLLSRTNPLLKISINTLSTTSHATEPASRPGPPPIRVDITESAGRGVFASRRIGAAELIHTAKPVVSHPSLSKLGSVCYLCLKRIIPTNHYQPFCSQECRHEAEAFYELEKKADWSAYHKYCRTLGLKYPLLVKRLACMVIAGRASANCIDILQPAHVLPEIEVEYNMLRNALEGINMTKENLKFLSEQWYADVLARVRINAFRVEMVAGSYDDLLTLAAASVEAEAGVGNAVYILPSFYNHDCDPNVHIIWMDSTHARLKALRDIDEGEELRICYIDASLDHNARQEILQGGFGFSCSCNRCLSGD